MPAENVLVTFGPENKSSPRQNLNKFSPSFSWILQNYCLATRRMYQKAQTGRDIDHTEMGIFSLPVYYFSAILSPISPPQTLN
jgi:hypothetical protein